MKLIVKFNLVFVGVFLVGLLVAGQLSYSLLQANAREEINQNARIIMETMLATRSYTTKQVRPLLETQMKYAFLPQSVPAFAATETFLALRTRYPEYAYKEATLNPTNPRDRATDWEADVVGQFKQDAGMTELVGERDTPGGTSHYLARPIRIKDPACLVCHSTVDVAPATMIERYGNANGFGWQLNDVIGAQVVSVPTAVPTARANQAFKVFMLSLTGVFAFIFVALNLMLTFIVIRPVTRLAAIADQVSLGHVDVPPLPAAGNDEIGALSAAFGRMQKSLQKAMTMLEE
jgi:protein-histidine pros-kinase